MNENPRAELNDTNVTSVLLYMYTIIKANIVRYPLFGGWWAKTSGDVYHSTLADYTLQLAALLRAILSDCTFHSPDRVAEYLLADGNSNNYWHFSYNNHLLPFIISSFIIPNYINSLAHLLHAVAVATADKRRQNIPRETTREDYSMFF
ncbi:hypothetical protein K449DRAFT_440027 [Hypoxylon sp. EC38]|nr:hypothetical protein K449DRAFT_440027 [Hypoxylon sp. EC38]